MKFSRMADAIQYLAQGVNNTSILEVSASSMTLAEAKDQAAVYADEGAYSAREFFSYYASGSATPKIYNAKVYAVVSEDIDNGREWIGDIFVDGKWFYAGYAA